MERELRVIWLHKGYSEYSIYDGITQRDPLSNVGIESDGSAGQAGLLYEELPNVYVFSAHQMLTTFCALF